MPDTDAEFEALLDYLKRSRSFDFSGYKRPSLMRRLHVQMMASGIESYADYTSLLEADPDEVKRLLNTVLINVTGFFRDAPAWEILQRRIIPEIIKSKAAAAPIRIWSTGCATGEEPYSLAILLAEAMGMEQFTGRVRIHATDLDEGALNYARQAVFAPQRVKGVPAALLKKYFEHNGEGFVLNKSLRRAVIFGRHDLTQDVPISRLDLLVCRNTLMYFNTEAQLSILSRFHFALNDGGYLFLGKAEMLIARSRLFAPVDLRRRIFVKPPNGIDRERLVRFSPLPEEPAHSDEMVDFLQLAFQTSPMAQLAVSRDGTLLMSNERANTLFRLTARDIGQPFQNPEISYRPAELRISIARVLKERRPVTLNEIAWTPVDGDRRIFTVQVAPIPTADADLMGVCISFLDITDFKHLREELESSNLELTTAYEEAQSSAEELESTNEELQSSAEELETTNEELQSANEEMQTMNEEMQSANEELETTNEELRQRGLELTYITNFMEAILSSLPGGIIVVGQDMQVQVWNNWSEDLWGLRAEEVIGKSLLSLDFGLEIEPIYPLLRACLAGGAVKQELTTNAVNRRGKSIVCRVTCTPVCAAKGTIIGTMLLATPVE